MRLGLLIHGENFAQSLNYKASERDASGEAQRSVVSSSWLRTCCDTAGAVKGAQAPGVRSCCTCVCVAEAVVVNRIKGSVLDKSDKLCSLESSGDLSGAIESTIG